MVAMHSHLQVGRRSAPCCGTPRQRREEREAPRDRPGAARLRRHRQAADEYARNLSYGDQRRLEVARALALRPKVLLLDEPTAGMNPQESAEFIEFVHRVRDEKELSILLIEHDMSVVMRVSASGSPCSTAARRSPRAPRTTSAPTSGHRGLPRQVRHQGGERRMSADTTPARADRRRGRTPCSTLDDLHVYYGNIAAVKGLTLHVYAGEIVTLIGSNGAGKSTTLRTISGLLRPRAGHGRRSRARDRRHRRPRGRRRSASATRPRAGAIFPRMTVDGEPRPRGVPAQGQGGDRRGPGAGARAVPAAAGTDRARRPAPCPAASSRCSPSAGR